MSVKTLFKVHGILIDKCNDGQQLPRAVPVSVSRRGEEYEDIMAQKVNKTEDIYVFQVEVEEGDDLSVVFKPLSLDSPMPIKYILTNVQSDVVLGLNEDIEAKVIRVNLMDASLSVCVFIHYDPHEGCSLMVGSDPNMGGWKVDKYPKTFAVKEDTFISIVQCHPGECEFKLIRAVGKTLQWEGPEFMNKKINIQQNQAVVFVNRWHRLEVTHTDFELSHLPLVERYSIEEDNPSALEDTVSQQSSKHKKSKGELKKQAKQKAAQQKRERGLGLVCKLLGTGIIDRKCY